MQMTPGVSRTRQERAASVAAESATFVEPSSLLPSSEYRFHVEGPFDRGGITRRKKIGPIVLQRELKIKSKRKFASDGIFGIIYNNIIHFT